MESGIKVEEPVIQRKKEVNIKGIKRWKQERNKKRKGKY